MVNSLFFVEGPCVDQHQSLTCRTMAASVKQRIACGAPAEQNVRRIDSGFSDAGERPRHSKTPIQTTGPSGVLPVRREHGLHLASVILDRLVPADATMRGAEGCHGLNELVDLGMQERTAILRPKHLGLVCCPSARIAP